MFRFGLVANPLCECGIYETPQHLLIDCIRYSAIRNVLKRKLEQNNIQFNFKNLLGGGEFEPQKQIFIRQYVWDFLTKIGKSNDI